MDWLKRTFFLELAVLAALILVMIFVPGGGQLAWNFIAAVFIAALLCYFPYLIYCNVIKKEKYQNALAEKSHKVTAKWIKTVYGHPDPDSTNYALDKADQGIYEYEWEGRKYQYRFITSGDVPRELTLYFMKDPRKAELWGGLKGPGAAKIKIAFICIFAVLFLPVLFGFFN